MPPPHFVSCGDKFLIFITFNPLASVAMLGKNKIKMVFLYLLLLCFFTPAISSSELCFDSRCQGGDQIQTIRFPFRIENEQPSSCGYPGFDLTCHATGQPRIHLPHSGNFSVQFIDYQNQEIWVNDPNGCLPSKILSLNLSGSPFAGKYTQDFTFFNCSAKVELELRPISCLSGLSYAVFASSSPVIINDLSSSCVVMKRVSVPVSWLFSSDLREDLRLAWKKPACGTCELRGGRCRPDPTNSTNEIRCATIAQPQSQPGIPRGARYAVAIGVGVPAALCFLGLLCCFCGRVRSYTRPRGHNSSIEAHWVISSQPTATMGLDGPTINSYPKFVLGQSLRLPEPNGNVCPICLSEYRPKEMVRTIPDCQHCFHQDCIDEWLRLNPSCPFCRNPPIKSFLSDPP